MSDYADPIVRLYDTVFDRAPDAPGLQFWDNALHQGYSLNAIASQFITAPEFAATYGQPDSASFVHSMYQNVLGRGGEGEGVSFWVYGLDHGLSTRADVVMAFSESAEHIAHMAASVADPAPAPAPAAEPVAQTPASKPVVVAHTPAADLAPAPAAASEPVAVVPQPAAVPDPAPLPGVPAAAVSYPVPGQKDGAFVWDGDEWFTSGTEGPDALTAHAGNNYMVGNGGDDTITGGPGNDVIIGGRGQDVMTGGGGNDLFVFHLGDGHDTITDFHRGNGMQFNGMTAADVQMFAAHGPPNNPGEMSSFAGYDVYYTTPSSEPGTIRLNGITTDDLGWVQNSFGYRPDLV